MMITGNAILSDLNSNGVPWSALDISNYLDIMYYARSGNKIVSPIINDYIERDDNDDFSLSAESRTIIAKTIAVKFNDKWSKLWSLNETEYDPIVNNKSNVTETFSSSTGNTNTSSGTIVTDTDKSDTGTVVTDNDKTDTGTVSDNREIANTGTVTDSGNVSQSDGIYGFNSNDSVGSTTMSGTDGNTRTDNLSTADDNTETRNLASTDDTTVTRNLTTTDSGATESVKETSYEGMNGVSVQELIESERNILQWNYWDVVFNDIDSFLALNIY